LSKTFFFDHRRVVQEKNRIDVEEEEEEKTGMMTKTKKHALTSSNTCMGREGIDK
jgi:hypothetical protein